MIELSTTQCGDPVFKHDCIHCCVRSNTCNVVYIAYKTGSKLVDWCTLYHLEEVEIMPATNLTLIPDYWTEMGTQNGLQPGKSELAIFGKRLDL